MLFNLKEKIILNLKIKTIKYFYSSNLTFSIQIKLLKKKLNFLYQILRKLKFLFKRKKGHYNNIFNLLICNI